MGKNAKPKQGTGLSRKSAPQDWRKRLERELRPAKRLFVLGVGNPDRADDGAGSVLARRLRKNLEAASRRHETLAAGAPAAWRKPAAKRRGLEAVQVLDGGEVPENATGVIRRFQPTHVLIVDAAAAGRAPGSIFFISKRKIPEEDLTTHRIPLSQLMRYLEESVGCRVILLGIEPGDTSPGKPMSPAVRKSCVILADAIGEECLRRPDRPARRRLRPEPS